MKTRSAEAAAAVGLAAIGVLIVFVFFTAAALLGTMSDGFFPSF